MITTPTVFILGAGASIPYGFPSGRALRDNLVNWKDISLSKGGPFHDRSATLEFSQALGRSKIDSIDAFLQERHERFLQVGKYCVAGALTALEIPSHCNPADEDWIQALWEIMRRGSNREISKNKIAFISYNYDRSLEHCLTEAMTHSFGVSRQAAWQELRKIPIVHPHGVLAPYLPYPEAWDQLDGESKRRLATNPGEGRFYFPSHESNLATCLAAEHLNLYWEKRTTDPSPQATMKTLLSTATRVVFLGFGFLDANMEHLQGMLPPVTRCEFFGTRKGLSEIRTRKIRQSVQGLSLQDRFVEKNCYELLHNYVDLESPAKPVRSFLAQT